MGRSGSAGDPRPILNLGDRRSRASRSGSRDEASPATPGSDGTNSWRATTGAPALDVERLVGLHDGQEQRHQLPRDRADALGLEARTREQSLVLGPVEAVFLAPAAGEQEELAAQRRAATLRLPLGDARRIALTARGRDEILAVPQTPPVVRWRCLRK